MLKIRKSLAKFFRYFGIPFLQSEGTTVKLYPAEFKQRVKAEYCNPMLWRALDRTDHTLVGRYLESNSHAEHLDIQWVIEMCTQKRYREVKEVAETIQSRCARRKQLYNDWYKMTTEETRESVYQRFVQVVPGDGLNKKFW